MSILAAITFAAASPLASPSDYVFAPFADESNAVAFIKGEIMGADADYRSIRAEDLAFLHEAMCERAALANGSWPTVTNATGGLKTGDWTGFSVYLGIGDSKYLQPGTELPSGMFLCDYGKAVTNVIESSWTTTNVIGMTISATTNWVHGGTNTFRADWPPLATMQVAAATNYTYATTNGWRTDVSHVTWMDCVTTNDSVFARKGTSGRVESDRGAWGLRDRIPLFASVTNMYGTLARGKFLLSAAAQHDAASNRFGKVADERSYSVHYSDGDADNGNLEWVKSEDGPTNRRFFVTDQYIVGEVYRLYGYAHKDAHFGYYRAGQEWRYEMSPTEITELAEEQGPSNNNSVAELLITHITVDVATRGNHTRIKNPVRLYHPFRLDYSETITLVTPEDGSENATTQYDKSGTAYGMACADGLCDFSGTNLVRITAAIDVKSMFTYMAGAAGLTYTTAASISADNLPEPRDATYEYNGQTIHANTRSSLSVTHALSLVGAPIVLYECDFSADVN